MKKNNKKIFILLGILFAVASIFLTSTYIIEPDYFWHIKAGEYMFKNGPLTHDVFSWIINGKYWMSHEWLFEVILYSLKLVFGKFHTIIYCLITSLSLFSIIFIYNRKKLLKNIPYTLLFLTIFVLIGWNYIQARPHMISFSFIALTLAFSYDLYNNENSKKIYFLPLIAILWANIHGGSSNLSYIFIFMFLFSGLFKFKFKFFEATRLTKKQIYKYILVAVLCILGICINIHGVKMLIYPYENMLDTTMLNNITEWRPISLLNPYDYLYIISIVIISILIFYGDKKIKLIDALLLLATIFLGLKSIRFWLYCPIALSFIIFDYFNERKLDKSTDVIISILIMILVVLSLLNFNRIIKMKYELSINEELVKIIKKEKPKRLFNMYDYGGELIYHDIPVFVDGRADLYSKYHLKEYYELTGRNGDYEKLIKKYNFDYMLVSKMYDLNDYMSTNEDFEIIYENKVLVLYKKTVN